MNLDHLKMSNKIKNINIKNRAYYFFNDIIDIKTFDPNNIKTGENSYKNIHIYYIWICGDQKRPKNVQCKYFVPYCQIVCILFVNGYFEEINGNKYLTLVPTNESKEKMKNMENCGVKSEI